MQIISILEMKALTATAFQNSGRKKIIQNCRKGGNETGENQSDLEGMGVCVTCFRQSWQSHKKKRWIEISPFLDIIVTELPSALTRIRVSVFHAMQAA